MGWAHIHIRLYTRSCYTVWVSFFPIYNDPLMFCVRVSLLGGHSAWRFWTTDGRLHERYLLGLCTESYFPKKSGAKECSRMYHIYIDFFLSNIFPISLYFLYIF